MAIVVANGSRQFHRREGDRRHPVLLLAHPIGFDHALWDRVLPRLAERLHVIRHDLRGHGASQVGDGPTHRADHRVAAAPAALREADLRPCTQRVSPGRCRLAFAVLRSRIP